MKYILLLLLLPFYASSQITFDTLKKAVAWQNSYVNFGGGWYGLTSQGHQYAPGINCNYNIDRSPAEMELVKVDLVSGIVNYKKIAGMLSPGSPGTSYWTHTFDSSGMQYIGLNYPVRKILKVNYKDSIDYISLGNGFLDGVSLMYSAKMGTDGHIYFGGSSGGTYISEYDPKADTFIHKFDQVDAANDYVLDIAGDSDYIYTQVGQRNNQVKLYATEKATGINTLLFVVPASTRFQIETKVDHHIYMSCGIDTLKKTFKLYHGQAIWLADKQNWFPVNNRMDYFEVGEWGQPTARTFYDWYNSILYGEVMCCVGNNTGWKQYTPFPIKSNRQSNTIKLLFGDYTKPSDVGYIGNNYGYFFWYDGVKDSVSLLGATGFNIYSSFQNTDSTIIFGSYPNGTLLEWNKNKIWTANTYFPSGANASTTYYTNPRIIAEFRTQTPAQFHHAKFLVKIKNLLVVSGDVIRTNNTFSIGAMDLSTYQYWGYDCNKIDRLSVVGVAAWRDSIAVVATKNSYGGTPKIYYYDPVTNIMVDSIQISNWTNYGAYNGIYIVGDTLIGSRTSYEYFKINLKTKQLIQDTSFLYYASGQLEDNYIWMNTPSSAQCLINQPWNSNCGMPTSYMLRYYNKYNGYSFNHIVYNITWDGYNIGRTRGLYPPLYSIKQSRPKQNLSAYPNPVSTYLYLSKTGDYTLYNMYGKLIARTNKNIMYMGNLAAGIYILRNGNNSMKIIKQ
jgi:hypothetical protein